MPRLQNANQDQVEEVYRESHGIWGGGLSLEQYLDLWREISYLPWARKHVNYLVWLDDQGRVLSSLKLYRPLLQLFGRISRANVLGAIFTPKAHRGRRHASNMLQAVIEECRGREDGIALLFSDIGTPFYEALGFKPLPAEEQWGRLPRVARGIPDGWELKRCAAEDLPAIHLVHSEFTARRPLALIRDEQHWQFLDGRSGGYFSRLKDPAVRQCCRVALEKGRFSGYLITVQGRGEWNIREVGASGGDARRMATILRLGAYEAWRSGLRQFYGWLPPDVVDLLGDWRLKSRSRGKARPMILDLGQTIDLGNLQTVEAAYMPYQDQF